MRIRLDLETCKKLLDFLPHERTSCTDENRLNQYANSEGWVSCARCWLLQTVQDDYVQNGTEFDFYTSIKIPKKDANLLIKEYADLLNEFGVYHPNTVRFYEANKGNKDFVELAIIAHNLKGIIHEDSR